MLLTFTIVHSHFHPGMHKEMTDSRGVPLQVADAATGVRLQGRHGIRAGVGHAPLDDGVGLLLRIQFGRIGRERCRGIVPRMRGQEILHDVGGVCRAPVPDHEQRSPEATAEVLQGAAGIGAFDRPVDVPRGQAAGRRHGDDARDFAPLAQAAQHRRVPARRPRRVQAGPKRVTRFVHAGNDAPLAPSFFFNAGQSRFSHARTTVSSRSRARGIGRCTVKPCAFSGRSRYR